MDRFSIGGRIAMARKKAGYTQKAFAAEIGVGGAALNRYEKGHRCPDAMLLSKMVTYLECDAEWLLQGLVPVGMPIDDVVPRLKEKGPCPPKSITDTFGALSEDELHDISLLLNIIRNKEESIGVAIKHNLHAFQKTPDKEGIRSIVNREMTEEEKLLCEDRELIHNIHRINPKNKERTLRILSGILDAQDMEWETIEKIVDQEKKLNNGGGR